MDKEINLEVSIKTSQEISAVDHYDYDKIIFDLDTKIDQLSSQADNLDYVVSIASGVLWLRQTVRQISVCRTKYSRFVPEAHLGF